MANIKEIAKLANVSVSTVSRVLNGHAYVAVDKRHAVLEAIERQNYSRNMNAIHLIRGRTNVMGVMLPFINHAYFARIVEGISSEALKADYQMMVCQTDYNERHEMNVLEMLRTKQIDGLIICSKQIPHEQVEKYARYGPIVACEDAGESQISSVFIDHYRSFETGMQFLISKGHRHIGFCLGRNNGVSSRMRREAYANALKSIREPFREEWTFNRCYQIEDGVEVLRKLIGMDSSPTALMVTGDQVAVGIIVEARKHGVRVPEDLAIIGFDNQPIAEVFDLTTIDNQLPEMGSQSFRIAYDRIVNETGTAQYVELEHRLIVRSTA